MSLPPFRTAPNSGPLPSTGITPRPQYYGPIRHPAGPACPSRGSGCRVHDTDRASRVATLSIFHACRRHYPGGNQPVVPSFSSRPVGGLPLVKGGSASASRVFGPAQRSLTFRPAWSLNLLRGLSTRVLQYMSSPPCTALAATGWSDSCRAGFAPARKARLSTAHVNNGKRAMSQVFQRSLGCGSASGNGASIASRRA